MEALAANTNTQGLTDVSADLDDSIFENLSRDSKMMSDRATLVLQEFAKAFFKDNKEGLAILQSLMSKSQSDRFADTETCLTSPDNCVMELKFTPEEAERMFVNEDDSVFMGLNGGAYPLFQFMDYCITVQKLVNHMQIRRNQLTAKTIDPDLLAALKDEITNNKDIPWELYDNSPGHRHHMNPDGYRLGKPTLPQGGIKDGFQMAFDDSYFLRSKIVNTIIALAQGLFRITLTKRKESPSGKYIPKNAWINAHDHQSPDTRFIDLLAPMPVDARFYPQNWVSSALRSWKLIDLSTQYGYYDNVSQMQPLPPYPKQGGAVAMKRLAYVSAKGYAPTGPTRSAPMAQNNTVVSKVDWSNGALLEYKYAMDVDYLGVLKEAAKLTHDPIHIIKRLRDACNESGLKLYLLSFYAMLQQMLALRVATSATEDESAAAMMTQSAVYPISRCPPNSVSYYTDASGGLVQESEAVVENKMGMRLLKPGYRQTGSCEPIVEAVDGRFFAVEQVPAAILAVLRQV